MRYRTMIEFDGPEGLTPTALATELDDHTPSVNPRAVDLYQVQTSTQGDRARALLVAGGRADLAGRMWENGIGDITVPWVDGQTPVDVQEVRLVLNAIREARVLSGTSTDKEVREMFEHWTALCAKRTGGPVVRGGE